MGGKEYRKTGQETLRCVRGKLSFRVTNTELMVHIRSLMGSHFLSTHLNGVSTREDIDLAQRNHRDRLCL